MRKIVAILLFLMATSMAWAQETFPRNDVKDTRESAYAFKNATIVADPQTVYNNGLLLIREGKIEYVGAAKNIPAGYIEIDLAGKRIYPSLVDAYTNYGLPKVERSRGRNWGSREQIQSKTKGAYNANEAIKAEYNAASEFTVNSKEAGALRRAGFGTVNTFRPDGIARGTSAVVTLGEQTANEELLEKQAAAHFSFNKGTSTQTYPVSAMGFIALLRQTYLDASWYAAQNPKPFIDQTLENWNVNGRLPQIFDTRNWLEVGRADKVGDEFGVQYIVKGAGDEYKRIDEIKATGAKMIIPLNYPDAFDVADPIDAMDVSLADMKHWELAPTNLAKLEDAGITFAITSAGIKNPKQFWPNLRKAIEHGLSEEEALKALTTTPAAMLGADDHVGSLATGKLANFIITSDNLFDKKNTIHENWVQGKRFAIKPLHVADESGKYKFMVADTSYTVEISGDPGKHSAKIIINDSTSIKLKAAFDRETISLAFSPKGKDGDIRMNGWRTDKGWKGTGEAVDGKAVSWEMTRTGDLDKKEKGGKKGSGKAKEQESLGDVIYPFVAHGRTSLPTRETILIKNVTVWTSEDAGVLESTDVLLKDGKIAKIGKGLAESGAVEIDGTGKHLTAGIIDEHSHIGATSINDVATNSGMVRIGDVIDPEQINIYRALSGGVTALQILHGSANPIGGQSALIKLRWGESPENMKIAEADGYIKFALGENVKRSSSNSSIRYPQTRMGVEQVYMDAFSSAEEYAKEWQAYNGLSKKVKARTAAPRRDLADETMLEIIRGERFISCHSYVQSEINMLMEVAERFGFKVNTFTHILEGYKVADKMAEHGVGGSTFSDWWAYKWEVRYAIPYNAAIMHNAGVTVAINSDDANQIRRLNQEAAKSVKYGGMSEEDVLKMVTINPAKLLHLDDRMGSIKEGKDADVVLWSDHPLSVYSIAEKTIVDGKVYYDLEKDKENRAYIQAERARLIQKMKDAKKSGSATRRGGSRTHVDYHCDDITNDSVMY
jgi:imidazolonepropionase-like amidohydrolase